VFRVSDVGVVYTVDVLYQRQSVGCHYFQADPWLTFQLRALPLRALPPLANASLYRLVNRGRCVWTTCLRSLCDRLWMELSLVQRPPYCVTTSLTTDNQSSRSVEKKLRGLSKICRVGWWGVRTCRFWFTAIRWKEEERRGGERRWYSLVETYKHLNEESAHIGGWKVNSFLHYHL